MSGVFAPPPPLPDHLQTHRFWIWLQLVAIRLYVIALRGHLVTFITESDGWGNTWLLHIGDAPADLAKADPFAFKPSRGYLAALAGDSLLSARPGDSRDPRQQEWSLWIFAPAIIGISETRAIPLPET